MKQSIYKSCHDVSYFNWNISLKPEAFYQSKNYFSNQKKIQEIPTWNFNPQRNDRLTSGFINFDFEIIRLLSFKRSLSRFVVILNLQEKPLIRTFQLSSNHLYFKLLEIWYDIETFIFYGLKYRWSILDFDNEISEK